MRQTTYERVSFAGHETFPFRYTWLPKAVKATAKHSGIFRDDYAMVEFGVGKNMVRSIRHWGLACGVIHEDPEVVNNRGRCLVPTELGHSLFGNGGWDPFLEDPATLWFLHWNLASTPERATTYYWTFNHAPQLEMTRPELVHWLQALATQHGWTRVAGTTLKKDVDCFIRSYVPARASKRLNIEDSLDCPLVDLGLLREVGKGSYVMMRGAQPSLPDEVFAVALLEFLSTSGSNAQTVPLEEIAFAPGSPGRVFCLSEDALLVRLAALSKITDHAVTFDETAGLRQLLIHAEIPSQADVLDGYYAKARAGVAA